MGSNGLPADFSLLSSKYIEANWAYFSRFHRAGPNGIDTFTIPADEPGGPMRLVFQLPGNPARTVRSSYSSTPIVDFLYFFAPSSETGALRVADDEIVRFSLPVAGSAEFFDQHFRGFEDGMAKFTVDEVGTDTPVLVPIESWMQARALGLPRWAGGSSSESGGPSA